jgi:hypothetical protein
LDNQLNRRTLLKSVVALSASAPLIGSAAQLKSTPAQNAQKAVDALRQKVSSPTQFPPSYNPMSGNPLKTRNDVIKVIKDLYLPLTPYYSKGGARVRLDAVSASFDRAAADMEGYSRPLWGLAPLAMGGGADFVDWDLFRRGLANGMNPDHEEFWGWSTPKDQRLVELAAIGFALTLIPHILWQPQSAQAKKHIAGYLQQAYAQEFVENNWLSFRFMIGLGLLAIGEKIDHALIKAHEQKIDSYYLKDGWYRDGLSRRADYYVPYALQFYGLLYSRLSKDQARNQLLQERAKALAPDFQRWFAEDGAAIPFGRSLTYRFGCAAYWSALAFADVPTLPWGQVKGIILRHLRWWSTQPMSERDGILSVGYSYPNRHMCEPYNSACSPYWAFKVFAFMALPETHPFWTSKEEVLPLFNTTSTQALPGMVIYHTPGDAIALASGQEEHQRWMRKATEKYAKFAYSARYGFGVETDHEYFDGASLDSMLGFSADGYLFSVRRGNSLVKIADDLLYAKWSPEDGVQVETWLLAAAPWHIRVHRIQSNKTYRTIEGGFAVNRKDYGAGGPLQQAKGIGSVMTPADLSGIRDLGSSIPRMGRAIEALPNSNIINAKSTVPQLTGEIPAGESILMCAVLAMKSSQTANEIWSKVPTAPSIAELEARIRDKGRVVGVSDIKI